MSSVILGTSASCVGGFLMDFEHDHLNVLLALAGIAGLLVSLLVPISSKPNGDDDESQDN